MKIIAAIIALLCFYNCLAQCPFPATLKTINSVCQGDDTLLVSSASTLSQILWYNGTTLDTTVRFVVVPAINAKTVAGGNGIGTAPNQFNEPHGVFVDAAGNIYVADAMNNRIQKFPPGSTNATDGITVAGGNGPGPAANQLNSPLSVFVDAAGDIYVADFLNGRVQKFLAGSTSATNGITVAAYQLGGPYSIFVDNKGNVYVTDVVNGGVYFFPWFASATTAGVLVASGVNFPTSVCIDAAGNIYVADGTFDVVAKFPPATSPAPFSGITVAGGNGFGAGPNQFIGPTAIYVDGSGSLYVADEGNNRVMKFPPGSTSGTNGVVVAGGYGEGSAANQLNSPNSIYVDGSGNIYVADYGNNRIQEYPPLTATTTTIDSILSLATPGPPRPGTYTAIVTDNMGCTVTTNALTIIPTTTPGINIRPVSSIRPSCSNSLDTISLVADITNGGAAAYQWKVNNSNAGSNSPAFQGVFANRDVISCTLTSNAVCSTSPSVISPDYIVAFNSPPVVTLKGKGLTCPGTDTLFISADSNVISKIVWYKDNAVDTTVTAVRVKDTVAHGVTVAGGNGKGFAYTQFNGPNAVCLDNNGNIYVADGGNNRVQKFPAGSNGTVNGIIVAGGNGSGTAANQLIGPTSVFVDGSGNLYVVDNENNRVQEFPPGSSSFSNGVTVAGGNGPGSGANQLFAPISVFVDTKGYVYVCDGLNNRVQQFPPGATSSTNGITVAGGNGQGAAADQFNNPSGVFIDAGGSIYVADFGNNRIQKFPPGSSASTNGVTVAGGSSQGAGASQLDQPLSVYVDAAGNIYVADAKNNRVQKFPPGSGSGVTVAGGTGAGNGNNEINEPYSIFVDTSGNLYVADYDNNRIQEFSPFITKIDTIYLASSTGNYMAIVTDSAGCSVTTNTIEINAASLPSLNITADKTDVCAGDTVIFHAISANVGPNPSYHWQVNGKVNGISSDSLAISTLVNGDIVNCTVTTSALCVTPIPSSDSITITVEPAPVLSFIPDTLEIKPGGTVTLNPTVSGPTATYQWSPATAFVDPTELDPIVNPVHTTTYQLTLTGNNGCQASDKTTVIVNFPFEMPNAFTPNGDGKNDVFRIPPFITQGIESFSIYNRFGQQVFLTTNGGIGWDGTVRGKEQPTGTYVWIIQLQNSQTGKHETASGTVLLIR
jgi:gliding motility-associated-like protein